MDFHLDWIAMALRLAADGPERARRDRFPLDGIANDGLVSGRSRTWTCSWRSQMARRRTWS